MLAAGRLQGPHLLGDAVVGERMRWAGVHKGLLDLLVQGVHQSSIDVNGRRVLHGIAISSRLDLNIWSTFAEPSGIPPNALLGLLPYTMPPILAACRLVPLPSAAEYALPSCSQMCN